MTVERQGRILLVDDDQQVLESIASFLTDYGFEVTALADGRTALQMLAQQSFDVVLSDITMPGMSGLQLLERIRRVDRETPVELMTGYAEVDTAVQAIQKGAFDFIIKPFRPAYLVHAVEKAIQYKRLRQLEKNYRCELEQTVEKRTRELAEALAMVTAMSRELIERLTAAAAVRDEETGEHVARIGLYARCLAAQLGMEEDEVELLAYRPIRATCSPVSSSRTAAAAVSRSINSRLMAVTIARASANSRVRFSTVCSSSER